MNYMNPALFRYGTAADAAPLSLLMPVRRGEMKMLVIQNGEKPLAVLLEDHPWDSIEHANSVNFTGCIFDHVEIEVDYDSRLDTHRHDLPLGAVIRRGGNLFLRVISGTQRIFNDPFRAVLVTDLPNGTPDEDITFLRWRIIKRDGDTVHVLHSVNVAPATADEDD